MPVNSRNSAPEATGTDRGGLVLASRGDALTPYLFEAIERRYPVAARLDPELTRSQRLLVAGSTVRPTRSRWAESFYKSSLGYRLRSRNARSRLPTTAGTAVLQVHALFEVSGVDSLLYIDCTHKQSADHWPAWNPLRGKALERWYDRERRAYAGARHLFAFSEATRDSLVGHYDVPAGRVSVVGAGINLRSLPEPGQVRGDGPPTVLMIGNDFERKGGPALLHAFAQVRAQLPDARLVLVGTPPALAPQPGVEVLGRIHDRARVQALYAQASVFCLPSVFDPFPLVLLEAMAHGLPCIATPTCGVPELVGDSGGAALVPVGDVDALAQALLDVLGDPEGARQMGTAGRARVADSFTWDHVVERMAPVLDRLV